MSPVVRELPPERAQELEAHRGVLWALGYRLTGSAAEAEDIVQETFVRALERPPRDLTRPWEPWLVRVATNLGIDALRRRQRTSYPGPWLPSPVELDATLVSQPQQALDSEARYERLESLSYAFLLALEALTPKQRAVLVLRDVLGYSGREAAQAVGTSEGNVKVVLHRARTAMDAYDRARCLPTRELQERTRHSLEQFMRCLLERDLDGLEKLLVEDVRTFTDGGGTYTAVPKPLEGRTRIIQLYLSVARRRAEGARFEFREVNGLPALWIEFAQTVRQQAPRVLLRCELNADGRIREIHAILAPSKLAGGLRGVGAL